MIKQLIKMVSYLVGGDEALAAVLIGLMFLASIASIFHGGTIFD